MAKQKKYEDSHFEEYFDTQTIVDIDIEKRMKDFLHLNLKLENLIEMPCTCRVCTEYSVDDLKQMPQEKRAKLIEKNAEYP